MSTMRVELHSKEAGCRVNRQPVVLLGRGWRVGDVGADECGKSHSFTEAALRSGTNAKNRTRSPKMALRGRTNAKNRTRSSKMALRDGTNAKNRIRSPKAALRGGTNAKNRTRSPIR